MSFSHVSAYWQQRVEYTMEIDMDVKSDQFTGKQILVYYNNSPDTLTKVFYHLYFNAFQPGSMMDIRSRTITDPDRRVGDRIAGLNEREIGYQKIKSLLMDKKEVEWEVSGTILEVDLPTPLLPGKKTTFYMEFEAQVPVQIRRSGRDNTEGIRYSMTQWYPKIAEYDEDGWHSNPYIGREFHGVWGDFDVTIHIDKDYILGATGILQNTNAIGYGYEESGEKIKRPDGKKLSWNFKAENVHDFAWTADPDYLHKKVKGPNGMTIHLLYQDNPEYSSRWDSLAVYAPRIFEIMNANFGVYPYGAYSILQGGDGGMEYPMATLITGNRSVRSLVGVTIHEAIHSWYQGVLATNESKYPWMDEGFTTFASNFVDNEIYQLNEVNPYSRSYRSYYSIAGTSRHEPLTTHADHYKTNRMYGIASYSMGSMALSQLLYIVGEEAFFKGMKRFYYEWKFKHPRPEHVKRALELESGLELDWFFENWIGTTNLIDYQIMSVLAVEDEAVVTLQRKEAMPMPLEIRVTKNNGEQIWYYIPMRMMRGEKQFSAEKNVTTLPDWPWTFPNYEFSIPVSVDEINRIEIDPYDFIADINKRNNQFPLEENKTYDEGSGQ